MGAVLTPVALANMALASFGGGVIQSFTDTTPRGAKVALLYPPIVNGLLAEYPWTFTRQVVPLAPLAEVSPDTSTQLMEGWRDAYRLPANSLAPPIRYLGNPRFRDRPLRDFEVIGQTLYCNANPVWALARFPADPSVWPAYFVKAAIDCLAAELIMPISGNAGLKEELEAKAWGTPEEDRRGGTLGLAKRLDAQNEGPTAIRNNPLTDCRR